MRIKSGITSLTNIFTIGQYLDGVLIGTVSGMGRNKGTQDTAAYTRSTAQRWARQLRKDNTAPGLTYKVDTY